MDKPEYLIFFNYIYIKIHDIITINIISILFKVEKSWRCYLISETYR